MRVRTGLPVLWRRRGASQVGVDPRCAVVLDGLTPAEQRLLDHLDLPRSEPSEAELLRLGRASGVPAARVRELLRHLEEAGVLDRATPAPERSAEEAYWARLRPDGDGATVLARRETATVAVVGLDPVGLRIAVQLAEAGVGTLLLEDGGPAAAEGRTGLPPEVVRPDDIGPYRPGDLGRPRRERARARLRADFPRLRTEAPAGTAADLTVLSSAAVADPVRMRALLREDLAHLPVVAGEIDVSVGPLVVPGEGPCGRCLDLHRAEADAAWPALATQLRAAPPAPLPATVARLGAAVAAHQVLAALDRREVATRGASLAVGPLSPLPALRRWSPHPHCGCTGLAEARSA